MRNYSKIKLKRRGEEMYRKYFYNPNDIIEEIIRQYDNKEQINNEICQVVFADNILTMEQIYNFISLYPIELKRIKYINNDIAVSILNKYSDTINIIKDSVKSLNPRASLIDSARKRAKDNNIPFNIISEDIILNKECPILKIPISYSNNVTSKNSGSLDRIIPEVGYVRGNIQVISMLANTMKSNATKDELLTFSNSMLEIYNITK